MEIFPVEQGTEEVRRTIEIKPSLALAHENLSRLALRTGIKHQSFWDFWNTSWYKRAVAIILSVR